MKKIVWLLAISGLSIIMADDLLGQIVIRDSVTISPKNVKSDLNTIQTLNDCDIGTPRQLVLFTIFPGTVTITTLANEYSPPGLTLGPLYISNARFVGQGDTITVFNSIGGSWTREFTQIRQATIWLVLGPEGTPDSGPTNKFQVLGTYPIDFDFFMCGHPEDDDSDLFLKFANFNYKHVPFPVDHFTIRPNNTTISPGEFTHFFIQGMDRYDNRINGRVADTTFVNVSLDANSARFGGLTLTDPDADPEEGPVPEPVTSDKLENIRAGTVVYFIANGEAPSLAQTITITMTKTNDSNITGTGNLTVTGTLDHFQVTLQPDTIAQSETATITVQAKDNGNNNISIPNETPLKLALDTNGELLGNFIAPNGSQAKSLAGIAYGDARAGKVKYIANGDLPDSTQQMMITVSKSDDATINGTGSVVVLKVSVEILNAALAVTDHVQVARWDNAYDASSNPLNEGTTADNFIDLDPERFFVQVTDPTKDTDPNATDKIMAKIGTLFASGAEDDDLTEIELFETGNNTGVFDSESQLLVTPDLTHVVDPYQIDDLFLAHDGISGTVDDDTKNDRTHLVTRDGSVKAEYELPNGSKLSATVNVCQRNPDERRRLEIRVRVFNEPFRDTGYDHDNNPSTPVVGAGNGVFDYNDLNGNGIHDSGEPSESYIDINSGATAFRRGNHPSTKNGRGGVVTNAYVQDQIARANIAWEQACIQVVQIGATMFVDAPKDSDGKDILTDEGELNLESDVAIVYNTYAASMTVDVLDAFFTGPIGSNRRRAGRAYPAFYSPFNHGEHSFVFVRSNIPIQFRTLAHEIGHILSNQPDIPNNNQWIFFPQTPTSPDHQVNTSRRITLATADACRTVRPAGNLTATGNRMLKTL